MVGWAGEAEPGVQGSPEPWSGVLSLARVVAAHISPALLFVQHESGTSSSSLDAPCPGCLPRWTTRGERPPIASSAGFSGCHRSDLRSLSFTPGALSPVWETPAFISADWTR